jgi:recombination protein RecT
MSNGLATLPKPANDMSAAAHAKLDLIIQMLPPEIKPASFCVACINELNKVEKCTVQSAVSTVYNCAIVGLIPGGALGHAYFIPYKGSLQLVIGFRGMIELAMASDFLRDVHTDVILRDEKWRHWKDETGPRCEHEIPIDRPEPDRANVIGAYCIYSSRDGGKGIHVMNRKQLDRIDKHAHVWNSHYAQMTKKSTVRGASKEWRLSYRLATAVQLDEQFDREEPQEIVTEVEQSTQPLSLKELPTE